MLWFIAVFLMTAFIIYITPYFLTRYFAGVFGLDSYKPNHIICLTHSLLVTAALIYASNFGVFFDPYSKHIYPLHDWNSIVWTKYVLLVVFFLLVYTLCELDAKFLYVPNIILFLTFWFAGTIFVITHFDEDLTIFLYPFAALGVANAVFIGFKITKRGEYLVGDADHVIFASFTIMLWALFNDLYTVTYLLFIAAAICFTFWVNEGIKAKREGKTFNNKVAFIPSMYIAFWIISLFQSYDVIKSWY